MGPVRIEIIFDTICPWCYVGKRRLARALSLRPHIQVETVWRPFLLNPDMPEDGVPRQIYLERKFGSRPRVERMLAAVTAAGAAEGLHFAFEDVACTPNTVRSHRLVALAAQSGLQWHMVEAIFSAYFLEGQDIGAVSVLTDLGLRLGLEPEALAAALQPSPAANGMQNENTRAHRLGVNGVPCYIFDGTYAVAGAQEPDVLVRLLDLAHEGQMEHSLASA